MISQKKKIKKIKTNSDERKIPAKVTLINTPEVEKFLQGNERKEAQDY